MEKASRYVSTLLFLGSLLVCSGQQVGIVVPSYFPMFEEGGRADFDRLVEAAQVLGNRLVIVLNMSNGPAATDWDFFQNYVDLSTNIRNAGGKSLGYVYTQVGDRAVADIQVDVDTWYSEVGVDGIFFDEGSQDLEDVDFYQTIHDYVKAKDANAIVLTNPGGSNEQAAPFLDTYDIISIRENPGSAFATWENMSWAKVESPSKFLVLIHHTSDWECVIGISQAENVGWVYATDVEWRELPSYWDEFVAGVASGATYDRECNFPDDDTSKTPIIAGVVGTVVFFSVLTAMTYWVRRRRRAYSVMKYQNRTAEAWGNEEEK